MKLATICESDYEGLEDADEFSDESNIDFCDGCLRDFPTDDVDYCETCGSVWCDYCLGKGSNFDWVPEFADASRTTEHRNAGNMIACPRCMSDDYVSPYPDDQYGEYESTERAGRPPIPPGYGPVEESYEGLEDADTFNHGPDACMHCGNEFNPYARRYIYDCHNDECLNKTCDACMNREGWDYDYDVDSGSVATCPECLAAYDRS